MKRSRSTASRSQQNIEIVPERLYFSIIRLPPKPMSDVYYFSVDANQDFQYLPFFYDFGPPSLLQIHKFYCLVTNLMKSHSGKLHFTCSTHPNHMSNGILFITSFRMIHLNLSPDDAYEPCSHLSNSIKPFRDASTLPCQYELTVISCLRGLHHAMQLGWYDQKTFDADEWERDEQVENGDMNWIIPGKLLAFATPYSSNVLQGGWRVATPNEVVPVFKKLGINHVVRLCQKFYNEDIFIRAGFKHTELYFLDGSTPPTTIREKFLNIIESDDIIALHCKAGLGRTGTLAGCHLIKGYNFTAHETIGWIRICRPGSVIGPQQRYLVTYAEHIHRMLHPDVPSRSLRQSSSSKLKNDEKEISTNSKQQQQHMSTSTKTSSAASRSPTNQRTKTSSKRSIVPPAKTTSLIKDRSITKTSSKEAGLTVQSIGASPHYPQPRKFKRAAANSRPTTVKK